MNRFFNQAKIVLNIHTWMRTHEHGINPRVFEACGSGTLQLSDAKREIQSHYDIDREIVLYHDTTELLKKLKYFLEHESEREAIASAAFERSLRDHTYADRITTMLHFIETDQQS
jgi:spore maturation protein CgeB